jgi:hypothetical protein
MHQPFFKFKFQDDSINFWPNLKLVNYIYSLGFQARINEKLLNFKDPTIYKKIK